MIDQPIFWRVVVTGDDAMDYTFDGGEAPMVEVASAGDSPYALSVTLLDPVTQNLICLQLSVELGGTIRAILHSSLLGTLILILSLSTLVAAGPLPPRASVVWNRNAAVLEQLPGGAAEQVPLQPAHHQTPAAGQVRAGQAAAAAAAALPVTHDASRVTTKWKIKSKRRHLSVLAVVSCG